MRLGLKPLERILRAGQAPAVAEGDEKQLARPGSDLIDRINTHHAPVVALRTGCVVLSGAG